MKIANRTSAMILAAVLVLTLSADSVRADQPTTIPAYFDGEIVHVIPAVSVNVTNRAILSDVANPIYFVAGQDEPVLGTAIPGVPHYNPWWSVVKVTAADGGDLPEFTSEEEILAAEEAGLVELEHTDFILLCQVVASK